MYDKCRTLIILIMSTCISVVPFGVRSGLMLILILNIPFSCSFEKLIFFFFVLSVEDQCV